MDARRLILVVEDEADLAATCARLLDLAGPAIVKDLLFTGRFIGAADAYALGLVSRIAPAGDIARIVHELAMEIASNAPLTIRATKEMTRRILAARRPTESDADLIEL